VQRKNMLASHYSQKLFFENRVGLHYSHFRPFCQISSLKINDLRHKNILRRPESAK